MHVMITKNDDLLGTLIHDVAHLLRTDIDRRLSPYNLTRVKWLALGIIKNNPDITQAELAQEMELGFATVGKLIDRLEERGFVERVPNPTDRRSNHLMLTQASRSLLTDLDSVAKEFRKTALSSLSSNEVKGLNKGLLKIKENLSFKVAAVTAPIMGATVKHQGALLELSEAGKFLA